MATTKDEEIKAEEVIVSRSVTVKDVVDAYQKGKNYYQLAREFFGSESEDAIERVRAIVEAEIEQN
jgi:hypothetical protein